MTGVAFSADGQARHTQPLGLLVGALQGLRSAILPIVAVWFGSGGFGSERWGGAHTAAIVLGIMALCAIGISTFFSWLAWQRRTYTVGPDDLRVDSGIISRSARSVPYDRIQDISLEARLLPRMLGLVSVRFETGAGGKDELSLSYLSEAEGEELRRTVRALKTGALAAAQGEDAAPVVEEEEGETLFAMGPRRLLTFGVFEFSLAFVAVLFGATQQFDFLLPFDLWDSDFWMGLVSDGNQRLGALGPLARFGGFIAAALSLVVVGLAAGVGKTMLRDWDFRLDHTPRGLRRRRGLLTKTDVVMPLHRVQALVIHTGWLRRLFGWHGLKLVSLAPDSGNASHDVVPFGQMAEVAPVAAVTGFRLPGDEVRWNRQSPAYRMHRAAIGSGACLLGAAGLGAVLFYLAPESRGPGFGFVAMLALAAFFVVQGWIAWRVDRHAMDEQQVYSRHGVLKPRLVVGNRVKLQSAEVRQGPLGRRGGYATLDLGLAGGTFSLPGLPVAEALKMRDAAIESMCATDFAATRQAS